MIRSDSFIGRLADALAADPLREKLLLAPSHRVGRQWLDRASVAAGGVANARATTIHRLLLDLADPGLRRRGLRVPAREEKIRLAGLALAETAREAGDGGYFTSLPPGSDLAEKFLDTLEELESAGVKSAQSLTRAITPPAKATELARLARLFAAARQDARLAGASDIHAAAQAGLAALFKAGGPPRIIVPESVEEGLSPLEWGFLNKWPEGACVRIAEEAGGTPPDMAFFAADSVMVEAREVFRRILAMGVPLDTVEVVCVDSATAVPALCDAAIETFGGPIENIPVTFNAGVPGRYAKPTRLLAAWLEWLEQGLPPEGLARMLDAGLLGRNWPGASPFAVASWIRSLPIDGSAESYRLRLDNSPPPALAAAAARLRKLLTGFLPSTGGRRPDDAGSAGEILEAAKTLLAIGADEDGMFDAYARRRLREAIEQWLPFCGWPGFDAPLCLGQTVASLRVMGLGPMPGRLHVGDLAGGGHSGRERLYIMGLDDGRYPGSSRQDPVLLDGERAGISSGLARSSRRRETREKALGRLLARAPGPVTMSYARTETGAGRENHPAGIFTRLAGETEKPIERAGLRPDNPGQGLNQKEDWCRVLLEGAGADRDAGLLAPWFPHLAAGAEAVRQRASVEFTIYDGRVPEAGEDWKRGESALSPSALEALAKCPLEFFFKKVLAIAPPKRYRPRPGTWMEGGDRGDLLHKVFQDFLVGVVESGCQVTEDVLDEHAARLRRLLDNALARELANNPPADHLAREREERELREAVDIFLLNELGRQRRGRPLELEASLGGAKEERPPWSRVQPVELALPSGGGVRLEGRIDRIDRLHDHGGLLILDYKSGKSKNYLAGDPFQNGRTLQPYLYTRMVEQVLAEAGRPEPVRGFEYFFVMPRDEGRPIFYSRDRLDDAGAEILELLASLIADGCFPFTTDPRKDMTYDYEPIFGTHRELVAASLAKTRHDPALAAWARLRNVDAGEGDDDADED